MAKVTKHASPSSSFTNECLLPNNGDRQCTTPFLIVHSREFVGLSNTPLQLDAPMLAINKCLLAGNGGLAALLPANILLFISTIHLMMLYLVLHAMHHPPPPSFSREGAVAIHCSCREIESREERFTLVLTNITPAAIAVRHRRHCHVFPTTKEAWSKEL